MTPSAPLPCPSRQLPACNRTCPGIPTNHTGTFRQVPPGMPVEGHHSPLLEAPSAGKVHCDETHRRRDGMIPVTEMVLVTMVLVTMFLMKT